MSHADRLQEAGALALPAADGPPDHPQLGGLHPQLSQPHPAAVLRAVTPQGRWRVETTTMVPHAWIK